MASGRELCYVLLLGILASYSVAFFALSKPNIFTCTVLRLNILSQRNKSLLLGRKANNSELVHICIYL